MKKYVFIGVISSLIIGCASSPKAPEDYEITKKGSYKVLIGKISDDNLESIKKKPKAKVAKGEFPKKYKKKVIPKKSKKKKSKELKANEKIRLSASEFLKLRLEASESISQVDILDLPKILSNDQKNTYKEDGYDFIIYAELKRFEGYQEFSWPAFDLFGALGVLVEMAVNPKDIGGWSAYENVEIIALSSNLKSWEGDVESKFDTTVTFYNGASSYALESLKSANNDLLKNIDEFVLPL